MAAPPKKQRKRSPAPAGTRTGLAQLIACGCLNRANVLRLEPLGALLAIELHPLAFREAAIAVRLDSRVVAKHVRASIVLSDETKALRVVEPLHRTTCHVDA